MVSHRALFCLIAAEKTVNRVKSIVESTDKLIGGNNLLKMVISMKDLRTLKMRIRYTMRERMGPVLYLIGVTFLAAMLGIVFAAFFVLIENLYLTGNR